MPGIPISQSFGPPVPESPESVGRSVSTHDVNADRATSAGMTRNFAGTHIGKTVRKNTYFFVTTTGTTLT